MSLLDDLISTPQREQGGSIATERFDFQACWGVSRILTLHSTGSDYAVAFEFHDDVVVLDNATAPTSATFYQLKTDGKSTWTLPRIARRGTKAGQKTASIAGKMYDNKVKFGSSTKDLVLVSNAAANFPVGPFNGAEEKDYKKFLADMKSENVLFDEADGALFRFEQAHFSLSSYETTLLGEVVSFIIEHGRLHECNYKAFYLTLLDYCKRRSKTMSEVPDLPSLLRSKFVTRSDLTSWVEGFVRESRSRPKWSDVVVDLAGFAPTAKSALKREWDRYEQQKMAVLDLPTFEFREAARRWIASLGNSADPMATILDKAVAELGVLRPAQTISASADYIKAVVLYEFYSQ